MIKSLLLFCLLGISSLFSLSLKDKFMMGECGSYLVSEQNELVTLLHLHSKHEDLLIFEEVTLPLHAAKEITWKKWLESGAKGHTAWILYEVDLQKRRVLRTFSVTEQAWIRADEIESFLIPFLFMELTPLSDGERIKKSPSPKAGELETRFWAPPQVLEGIKQEDPLYDVFCSRWPNDASELAGQTLIFYFDQNRKEYPFPYWIQVREGVIKFKIKALDSGRGLFSPILGFPSKGLKAS